MNSLIFDVVSQYEDIIYKKLGLSVAEKSTMVWSLT